MTERKKAEPWEKVVQEIHAGRHNGHLADIVLAINDHILRTQEVSLKWSLVLNGQTIRETDLTLGEGAMIQSYLDLRNWSDFDPRIAPRQLRALIITLLHKREGLSLDDAQEKADAMNQDELARTFKVYEVDNGPFDSASG